MCNDRRDNLDHVRFSGENEEVLITEVNKAFFFVITLLYNISEFFFDLADNTCS